MLGISMTTDEHADICYYHEDTTEASEPGKFDDFINGRCIDISKSRVHKAFHEAFGYSIDVDPTKYDGLLVSKSNVNSKHDGYIIQGPIKERESGRVYERLIDNLISDKEIMDYRVCVVGREIPFIICKKRGLDKRFDAAPAHTRSSVAKYDEFSEAERKNIIACAEILGLDVGEFDVLRDRQTKRLFIVDANKTPKSSQLSNLTGLKCLAKAAASFRRQFL